MLTRPRIDPAISLVREPEPLKIVIMLAAIDELLLRLLQLGLSNALKHHHQLHLPRDIVTRRRRDGKGQGAFYGLHLGDMHLIQLQRQRHDDTQKAEAAGSSEELGGVVYRLQLAIRVDVGDFPHQVRERLRVQAGAVTDGSVGASKRDLIRVCE